MSFIPQLLRTGEIPVVRQSHGHEEYLARTSWYWEGVAPCVISLRKWSALYLLDQLIPFSIVYVLFLNDFKSYRKRLVHLLTVSVICCLAMNKYLHFDFILIMKSVKC